MRLTIILVAPARAGNIGAAVCAMKTMRFIQLRIVDSEVYLEPATQWAAHGPGDIIDSTSVFPMLTDAFHDVDFTTATTARSRTKFHCYATPVELVPLSQEKSAWMEHVVLAFGREDSGLTSEELTLADVLIDVSMIAGYPSLNLGQAVMIYCYQLVGLMQQPAKNAEATDELQLQALHARVLRLLATLSASDDIKLTDWLQQRMGLLGQRDAAMLHRFLYDTKKNITK